jgi:hypothetical protein
LTRQTWRHTASTQTLCMTPPTPCITRCGSPPSWRVSHACEWCPQSAALLAFLTLYLLGCESHA